MCAPMCRVPWIKSASGKMDKVTLLLVMEILALFP